jgi:hypothetical protein
MNSSKPRMLLITAAIIAMLAISAPAAYAANEPHTVTLYNASLHVQVDQHEMRPPAGQRFFLYEGNTYVPLRFLSYALNKSVHWNDETRTVSVQDPSQDERKEIDEYNLNRIVRNGDGLTAGVAVAEEMDIYFAEFKYQFDGIARTPQSNQPGIVIDDTLYVPIRFFSESLGVTVGWNQETYTVSLTTGSNKKDPAGEAETPKAPITPTTPTTPTVPGPTSGGSVGTPSQPGNPSYDEIKARADAKISSLKNRAMNDLTALAVKYINSTDPAEKSSLLNQGQSMLGQYDGEFNGIMSELNASLTAYGYDTAIVAQYNQEYEQQKELGRTMLEGMRKK